MVQSVCACLQSIRRQVCIVQRAAADLNPHLPLDLIEILLQQHERIVRLVPTTYACSDTQIQTSILVCRNERERVHKPAGWTSSSSSACW